MKLLHRNVMRIQLHYPECRSSPPAPNCRAIGVKLKSRAGEGASRSVSRTGVDRFKRLQQETIDIFWVLIRRGNRDAFSNPTSAPRSDNKERQPGATVSTELTAERREVIQQVGLKRPNFVNVSEPSGLTRVRHKSGPNWDV
ncbi:hypothetical protein F2P81_016936 [Scophthalmus maximus]|uniref:Uncharacterized protein n=1 Tax=Scophthalmus maximus TaxID=52904 RepID=A0A6A4SCL4_SCOMX|nr:hypothetical protein F2P81_016936 [Scophthalmus maximus]